MLKFVLSMVIFLILFSGCAGKAEQSSQIDPMETAPSSVKEPAEIQMADSSKLPAGYEVLEEPDRLLITDNGKIIGAIETYPISNDMMFDPYYRWLEALGIPDFETEGLCRSGGSSLYGNWETHFESDVPPGVESIVSRYHTFYVGKTKVWDVWFDLLMIDRTTMDRLLKALTVY